MAWSTELRKTVLSECRAGRSYPEIAATHGVPRGTIAYWVHMDRRRRGEPAPPRETHCPRCDGLPINERPYAYTLGLYLGDGHIISKKKQHHLSIACCDDWPGLMDAAEEAMKAVMPGYRTGRRQMIGCTEVKSYTAHWVCMLPQHGPGKKHNREIRLMSWQREIVERQPWELIRGLIHSDGCRITNWATRVVAGKKKRYEYPRYFFTNKSTDIVKIYTDALDLVGVQWRANRHTQGAVNVSVARRESVALMDLHVGPKY